VYSNMVVEGITPPRDRARLGALKISVRMREVRTVASEYVAITKVKEPKAVPGKDAAGHETKTPKEPKPKSFLSSGVDFVKRIKG
jgi:hypothetical protein